MARRIYKKRRPIRRRRPRRARISFKTRVIKALEGEKKTAKLFQTIGLNNQIVAVHQLMPNIRQGVGAHAERVGNKISLKKLRCSGFIRIPSMTSAGGDTEHLSRMLFIRQRNVNAATLMINPLLFDENRLMEYDQPYLGTPNNWLQHVNRSRFVCRKDIKKHYSVSGNYQGTNTETPNPDSIRFFSYTITFGKQGKALNYPDNLTNISSDFPYVLGAALHQTDGSVTAGLPTLELYTEATYTDL